MPLITETFNCIWTWEKHAAKTLLVKDFYIRINNSIFGKTMENIRRTVDVIFITDEKKLLKYSSKPIFVSSKFFSSNLLAIHKIKEGITLKTPANVGMMSILDLSKTLISDFHYKYVKSIYRDEGKLFFTDTDNLTYEIERDDVYKDFWSDKNEFYNSQYFYLSCNSQSCAIF